MFGNWDNGFTTMSFIINTALDHRTEYGTLYGLEVDMSIETDIRSISYLKSRAADLLKQVNDTQRPVVITQNGEPRAVLQDPATYQSMRNAIGLLKLIAQGEDAIRAGRFKSQDDVFADLKKRLAKK